MPGRWLLTSSTLLLFLAAACARPEAVPAAPGAPVIIISIDTLRSDRLPAYGYGEIRTPHIDRLRADSILYERAYTHYPLTLPAHASLLTGLLPADHGIRDNAGFRLGAGIPTAGEVLQGRGYATGAAVSAYVLRRETGLGRGFDVYDDALEETPQHSIGMMERRGETTVDAALRWIDGLAGGQPFFLFLHLFEPHAPYEAPEPYRTLYANPYDGEVAWVDQIAGRFLEELRGRGLYDQALILLLSDHGEGLGDHGESEHGLLLYRETIQVPMIVKLPGGRLAGRSVSEPVQLIDVLPTIAAVTASQPPAGLPGRSLLVPFESRPAEPRALVAETYYPRFGFGWSELHSLIEGADHYIHGPKAELFDLKNDPAERNNRVEEERRTVAAMRRTVAAYVREPAGPGSVDAEERAALAALGYLGSGAPTALHDRPDPRDKLDAYRSIQKAFSLYRAGRYAESLQFAGEVAAKEPAVVDVWDLKARLLVTLGRPRQAIEAGRTALSLAPGRTDVAVFLTSVLLDSGRFDEAHAHARLIEQQEPALGRELRARTWLAQGDVARAAEEAGRALTESRDRLPSLVTLARVERKRGDLESALSLLNEAVAAKSARRRVPGLFATRGDVLARLGRFEEAERDLRAEIAAFPGDPEAHKSLIVLLVADGRLRVAGDTVRALVESAPVPRSYVAVCEALEVVGDRQGVRYWSRKGLERFPDHDLLRKFAAS